MSVRDGFLGRALAGNTCGLASIPSDSALPCGGCGICIARFGGLVGYFLYFSPKEEMEEAFTKIAVTNGGQMDGDGIRVNQLPLPVEPVLPKPAPKSYGMLSQYTEEEDSLSITFSMSFFSATTSTGNGNRYGNQGNNGFGRQQTVIRNHL